MADRGDSVTDKTSPEGEADAVGPNGLRWYQAVPRYAWIVLGISALGWMFDAMDQNLFSLVRQHSVMELLQPHVPASELNRAVSQVGGQLTAVFMIGWA